MGAFAVRHYVPSRVVGQAEMVRNVAVLCWPERVAEDAQGELFP